MDIKDDFILHGMTWAVADEIEYNTISSFQTSNSNTPGYSMFRWTFNAYTLKDQYTCHLFDTPVIITEGELFFPANFMTTMIKLPIGITI